MFSTSVRRGSCSLHSRLPPRVLFLRFLSKNSSPKSKKSSLSKNAQNGAGNAEGRELEHDQDYGEFILAPSASSTTRSARGDLGSSWHIPVVLEETLSFLSPIAQRENSLIIDATFGGGGHSLTLLERFPHCRVIGLDRDAEALNKASNKEKRRIFEENNRLKLIHAPFSRLEEIMAKEGIQPGSVAAIFVDLGVSSLQLDEGRRGFSFKAENNALLDMRMDQNDSSVETVAQLLEKISEQKLSDIIWRYGEDRFSRRIAHGIIEERKIKPITHTLQLAEIVDKYRPDFRGNKARTSHSATKTFQALRIAVNDELRELKALLTSSEKLLAPGGRLVSIAFHALEDGMIKTFLRKRSMATSSMLPTFRELQKGPIAPTLKELEVNIRARSAKLRCAERTFNPISTSSSSIWADDDL